LAPCLFLVRWESCVYGFYPNLSVYVVGETLQCRWSLYQGKEEATRPFDQAQGRLASIDANLLYKCQIAHAIIDYSSSKISRTHQHTELGKVNMNNNSNPVNSTDAAPQPPRSKTLLTWMIISQILGVVPILVLGGVGIFGILLDGTIDFRGFLQFLSPLLMLIPLIGSWVAYGKRNEKLAWILTSLPILYTCLDIVIVFGWIFI